MNLFESMRVFRRVVELQSFSAAARDLRLSNAAVSKQVAVLEDHLRSKLLLRTTRKLSLTTAGAAYYEGCVRILDDVEDTERRLSSAEGSPRGVLRVNAPMGFSLLHLTPLVSELLTRFPEMSVDLKLTDRMVDVVEEGVDVVLRIATELPDSTTLVARRLARARHVVCASPKYLRRHGTPKVPADLEKHACLVYSGGATPGMWELSDEAGAHRVAVNGRLRVDNSVVIRDALVEGLGVALIPSFYVAKEIRSGALREVLARYATPPLSIYAVYQRSRHLSYKVRAFVDFMRERLAKAEWALPSE